MNAHWQSGCAWVAALSLRRRVLVLVAGAALMLLPGYSLWLEPAWLQWQQLQHREGS